MMLISEVEVTDMALSLDTLMFFATVVQTDFKSKGTTSLALTSMEDECIAAQPGLCLKFLNAISASVGQEPEKAVAADGSEVFAMTPAQGKN
jgi:hypothetical protein